MTGSQLRLARSLLRWYRPQIRSPAPTSMPDTMAMVISDFSVAFSSVRAIPRQGTNLRRTGGLRRNGRLYLTWEYTKLGYSKLRRITHRKQIIT